MIKTIGVIGSGQMGNGIAHVAAINDFNVKIIDIDEKHLQNALATFEKNLCRQIQKGLLLSLIHI